MIRMKGSREEGGEENKNLRKKDVSTMTIKPPSGHALSGKIFSSARKHRPDYDGFSSSVNSSPRDDRFLGADSVIKISRLCVRFMPLTSNVELF